jgi:hypothetical protein
MQVIAHLVSLIGALCERLTRRPVRWYLLLLFVVAAGPLGVELAFVVDLVMVVGVDVFVLSMLYYFSGSVTEMSRVLFSRCARFCARRGGVLPRERRLGLRSSLPLYVGHNLCVIVTPTRFVTLALLCFTVGPTLSLLGASHVV